MKNQTAPSPEALALQDNQKAITNSHAAIAILEFAIGKLEKEIFDRQTAQPDLTPLQREREDLLAGIAIGEDHHAALKKLDAKLEQLTAQRSGAKPALDALKQTAGGLERKFAETTTTLQKQQSEKERLLRAFYRAKAEAVGAEYLAAAQNLIAQYTQLKALHALLIEGGDAQRLLTSREGLFIPRFNVEAMPPNMSFTYAPDALYTTFNQTHTETFEWIGEQKAALRELGIEID